MKGKQGKQKRREQLCCLFIGCVFKFFNLVYGVYPEFTHSLLTQPSAVAHENKGSREVASLQNVGDDSEINKDAVFLDKFQKMLKKNETSVLFKPHLNKLKATFFEARRNLKKRINAKIQSQQTEGKQEQQRTDIIHEDDNNIFELLQNM